VPLTPGDASDDAARAGLPAAALRAVVRARYDWTSLRADALAGIVVGVVALPLSMALAIASGVPPQYGLYTAIVGGAVIAVLGGSRVQVSGPTAAFVALLVPVTARFGVGGLLLATLMAGLLLVILGATGMGRLVEFVPFPVTAGFTAGVAVVIATLQVQDFLGLTVGHMPEAYLARVGALAKALPTARPAEFTVGAVTLAALLLWPRVSRRVPAALVGLTLGALLALGLARSGDDLRVATINSRFSYLDHGVVRAGIPRLPPQPVLPWRMPGPDGKPLVLGLALVRALAPYAFAIAMLGAIESLLSAVVADGMTGHKHDPDAELVGQGIGNMVAPFLGGFAATGAIARTAVNVRAGARSPLAALIHSIFLLSAVVALAPALGYLPMASLAALLLTVAWNMSEPRHFVKTLRRAPRSDVAVLLACFGLTIVFDMVIAVTAGIVLASLLFMRRMVEVSGARLVGPEHPELAEPLPRGAVLYEIAGPLFFGAAQKALSIIASNERRGVRVVVLDVRSVPALDATGLVSLETLIERLNKADTKVILAGVQPQPLRVLARAGWRNRRGRLRIFRSFERAIELARRVPPTSAAGRHPQ
jgi:SulP family sulfate permease